MTRPTRGLSLPSVLLMALAGCSGGTGPADATPDVIVMEGGALDAADAPPAADITAADTAGPDTSPDATAPVDAAPDATPMDVAADVSTLDVTADATTDGPRDVAADAANRCVAAGGTCVAVIPGACMGGQIGNRAMYSCGPGFGTSCCIPNALALPRCEATSAGARWVNFNGEEICASSCTPGTTPMCRNVGTRSEGWYTSATMGCSTGPGDGLVIWTNCD